ncbi:MAG: alkaline phosphatase [Spirochaetia bacterium]|nr:alkaline phosphatase [Spirochaetia bacterium]MCI7435231.1 alkaline phosphatase [Spirochaetia bacterium]
MKKTKLTGAVLSALIGLSAIASLNAETKITAPATGKGTPKYVFVFIGDGMSYPQIQSAAYYTGKDAAGIVDVVKKSENPSDSPEMKALSFYQFPVAGSASTYDATSFAPDSASTATSIFTGYKTHSSSINVDITKKIKYRTIAEQLRDQKKYKIGVISTVNLNHATPAATYAHQASRKSNYPIGQELVSSNFEYFAGGALMDPQDKNKDKTSIYDLAKNAGYKVCFDQKSAAALKNGDKALVIAETLADSDSMSYDNDRKEGEWALRDYVRKGIEVLDNKTGFFMMVEGGKVDWACHANDARSSIADTLALSEAVEEAISFYNKHPKETLILVTADHETGGLTIGYAGTDYNLFFRTLDSQKISYAKFDSDYVSAYKKNGTSFEAVMKDVEKLFGLKMPGADGSNKNGGLVLTDYELSRIKTAYEKTIKNDKNRSQMEYDIYGTYEPLTITITHILNAKSGLGWTSNSHTGLPVPVFALGAGQEEFKGFYDNTEIYKKLAELTKVVKD